MSEFKKQKKTKKIKNKKKIKEKTPKTSPPQKKTPNNWNDKLFSEVTYNVTIY